MEMILTLQVLSNDSGYGPLDTMMTGSKRFFSPFPLTKEEGEEQRFSLSLSLRYNILEYLLKRKKASQHYHTRIGTKLAGQLER